MSFPDYVFTDTNNGQLNPSLLHEEIDALSLGSASLVGINVDHTASQFTVVTDVEPSNPDKALVDAAVASHAGIFFRPWILLAREPEMEPVVPGASKVVANDRPAIEVQDNVTGYAAIQTVWLLPQAATAQIRVKVHFVLKALGNGNNVRIAARMKAQSEGEDSTVGFTTTVFVAKSVTFTTVGEVFVAELILDASSADLDDAVALQVGRDGNNELGAGINDDVDQAVQIIGLKVEAR